MRPRPKISHMPDESEVVVVHNIKFKHFRDFPMDKWRWKNFSPQELASRREGELMINEKAMDALQRLRELLGRPMIVNSGYRSAAHNKALGAAPNSYHMRAMAFDVRMDNQNPQEFERLARQAGFTGFGYYVKNGFMHIDIGPARTWGTPFPKTSAKATPDFPVEKPLTPETPSKDGILGAVGVVAGSGIVTQIGDVLGDMDTYLQYGLWTAAALALGYIAYKRLS